MLYCSALLQLQRISAPSSCGPIVYHELTAHVKTAEELTGLLVEPRLERLRSHREKERTKKRNRPKSVEQEIEIDRERERE